MRGILPLFFFATLALSNQASKGSPGREARPPRGPRSSRRGRFIGLVVGAGAGLGLGMMAALKALPDASCTTRKTLLTAGSFGTIGAAIGYRIGEATAESPQPEASLQPSVDPRHVLENPTVLPSFVFRSLVDAGR